MSAEGVDRLSSARAEAEAADTWPNYLHLGPWVTAVERIVAARVQQAEEHAIECERIGMEAIEARLLVAAERDALRERVEALAGDLTAEVEELRADIPPVGPGRVAHLYRTAGLSESRDRLRAALDGTPADRA